MKVILALMSLLKRYQINELGIEYYPHTQSQRWNSVYLSLDGDRYYDSKFFISFNLMLFIDLI